MYQHNIEYQGFQGMGVAAGSIMSKHSIGGSSNYTRYQPELTAPLLNRLSGHEDHIRKEIWDVSRTKVGTPIPVPNLVLALFPKYLIWKDEASNATEGDSTNCALNFLNVTLPLLSIVLVQDGIYFACRFPDDWVSNYLRQKVPNFDNWCTVKLEEIAVMEHDKILKHKNVFDITI